MLGVIIYFYFIKTNLFNWSVGFCPTFLIFVGVASVGGILVAEDFFYVFWFFGSKTIINNNRIEF